MRMKSRVVLIFFLVLFASVLALAIRYYFPSFSGKESNKSVKVTYSFSYIDSFEANNMLTTSMRVKFKEGKVYGWRIYFKTELSYLTFKIVERVNGVIEKPGWVQGPRSEYLQVASETDSAAYMRLEMKPEWKGQGYIGMTYVLEKGDSLGDHSIEIFYDDRLLEIFHFHLY